MDATKRDSAHVYGLAPGGGMHTLVKSQLDISGLTGKLGTAYSQDKSIVYGCAVSGNSAETRPVSAAFSPRLYV